MRRQVRQRPTPRLYRPGRMARSLVFVSGDTHLIIDINGYFAPAGPGGLSLFNLTQCRVLDTRNTPSSPFIGQLDVNIQASPCNAIRSPRCRRMCRRHDCSKGWHFFGYMGPGTTRPPLTTLSGGVVTSNMAIVATAEWFYSTKRNASDRLAIGYLGLFRPVGGTLTVHH